MPNYHKLYTPQDSAVVFIDHQPQMTFGVANMDRAIIDQQRHASRQVCEGIQGSRRAYRSGNRVVQRLHLAAVARCVPRPAHRRALLHERMGRRRIPQSHRSDRAEEHHHDRAVDGGLRDLADRSRCWARATTSTSSRTAVARPPSAAQEAALSRMVQAGAVRLTTIAALLEWQRDWKNKEHYNALMGLLKQHGGAYGSGVEYAYTMVHHAPQSAQKPQVVPKKAA